MLTIKSVYELYQKDVYRYVFSLTHDSSVCEDLTSETFLSALLALPGFKGKSSIKTWLFSIARNKWYEYLRKNHKDISLDTLTQEYINDGADTENDIIKNELVSRIYALLKLEGERTENIVLMRIQGYSYLEIAERYNISENSARVIDFRAKNKIKQQLEKEGFTNG